MTTRTRKKQGFDWGVWVRSFGVWGLGMFGMLVAFYFTTTSTLKQHELQFNEVGKRFEQFNGTLVKNYDDWAKVQKAESEERAKTRDQLMQLFTTLSTNSAATNATVQAIGKQLDSVTNKIDSIQSHQQNRK